MMRLPLAALVVVVLLASAGPAICAERLVVSLTNHRVMITSSYTGVELVLFGSVERDATAASRAAPYDIVATITGPREPVRARRKARVLGIWVNTKSRTFVDPPSYLAVLASRPLDAIASPEIRRRLQLGISQHSVPGARSQ